MSKKSPSELHAALREIDPESADAIHENNVKRVIRALEIYHLTGKTKSYFDAESKKIKPPYEALIIGLDTRDRQVLYDRINKRVDIMLENGLLDEVKKLDCASFRSSVASDGIGYKEILAYFDGRCTLEEAVEQIKQASRNYAKRQLTWFRRNKSVKWIFTDEYEGQEKFKLIVNSAINLINNN
jgi:tRNA dimethylallyltransferase